MVDARRIRAGALSATDRAQSVARHFEAQGVPTEKIAVNDSQRAVVSVQEGTDADLSPDEFGVFMRTANALVNDGGARFATPVEKCVIVPYECADTIMTQSPEEAGQQLADPATTEPINDQFEVGHHGGNRFSVVDLESGQNDESDALRTYRVDLDAKQNGASIETPSGQPEVENGEERNGVVAAVIVAMPRFRPGPQESLTVNVGATGNGSTGSSGGSSGNSTGHSDVDPVTDPGSDHDHDPETLIEDVDEWLTNYASVKSDIIEGAWELSFKKLTNPANGDSNLGVYIKTEPFAYDVWNNSDGEWASDDAKDEWTDHTKALRSIFKEDDGPVNAFSVPDPDSDYDDWYNYVPASEVADL